MGLTSLFILLLGLISLALSAVTIARDRPLVWRFAMPDLPAPTGTPIFVQLFDHSPATGQAHAPAILVEEDGFRVVWFEGSAEAQADVDIWGTQIRQSADEWCVSPPAPVITRSGLGTDIDPQQLVVTLGNAVENQAVPGRVFATVVSIGGWAMASVTDLALTGGVCSARKLNLSPFLNRSHLVKSPMVAMADGSYALPAYFEMGATYGSFVRFAEDGRVRDARRMLGQGVKPIQPMIIPHDASRATAFLRDFDPSGVLWISRTEDGGQHWSGAERTDIPNPNAPVAALRLADGRLLMAMNDDPAAPAVLRLCGALSDAAAPAGRRDRADLFAQLETGGPGGVVQRCLGGRAMMARASLTMILAWMAWGCAALFVAAPFSLLIGLSVALAVMMLFRQSLPVSGLMALLEPIGVILPLLILRQAAIALGWEMPVFASLELILFLLAYIMFLVTAFGLLPFDLYRLGYAPMPVAVMVLALCAYGLWSGNWFIALAAVIAQALWVARQGSSNWFDHILHVALIPVVVTVLIARLF